MGIGKIIKVEKGQLEQYWPIIGGTIVFNQIKHVMNAFNHIVPKFLYLTLSMSMLIVGCDNSSGGKETEQLNNDNDPTNIEQPISHDSTTTDGIRNNQMGNVENMENQSDIVVMENFNDQNWEKFSTDRNFGTGENLSLQNINTKNIGAESWKSYENYQYRVIYYSENGTLKAKPIVKTNNNQHFQLTTRNNDSLALKGLWDQIQSEVGEIKRNTSLIVQ